MTAMNFGHGASDLLGPGTRYASVCAHQSVRAVNIYRSQPDTREALEKYVAHASVEGITLPEWLALEEPPPAPTPSEDDHEAEVAAIRADLARLQEGLDTIRARLDQI